MAAPPDQAGVTHEASRHDHGVPHTIRSLPPITLRLPLALRQELEAQAQAAGQSLNAYLTQRLTEATAGAHVPVTLDDDLKAWLNAMKDDGESLGEAIAWLVRWTRELLEDRHERCVLLSIPDECQPWLATQAQRYRARGREQAILALLRRAAQGPSPAPRPRHSR
jgi:hypothetical protein